MLCAWGGHILRWGAYLVGGVIGPRGQFTSSREGKLVWEECTWSGGMYVVTGGVAVHGWSSGDVAGQVLLPLCTESQTPVKT